MLNTQEITNSLTKPDGCSKNYAHARTRGRMGEVLEKPSGFVSRFSGPPPREELERAQDLRNRLKVLVGFRPLNDPTFTDERSNWMPWCANGTHTELFDDWCTALACQQPALAVSIAKHAAQQWHERMRLWIATELVRMENFQQKPTLGWVNRIAAKLGKIEREA